MAAWFARPQRGPGEQRQQKEKSHQHVFRSVIQATIHLHRVQRENRASQPAPGTSTRQHKHHTSSAFAT